MGLLFLQAPEGTMRFEAYVSDEDEDTFTLSVLIEDWDFKGYSKAVRKGLGFTREEVHSHHLEVYFYKILPKLQCPITRTWLYFVCYRGLILRVAEEREGKLLLVGLIGKEEVLHPILSGGYARWVDREECEPVEAPCLPLPADCCYPLARPAAALRPFQLPRNPNIPYGIVDLSYTSDEFEMLWRAERDRQIRQYRDDTLLRLVDEVFLQTRFRSIPYSRGYKVQVIDEGEEHFRIRAKKNTVSAPYKYESFPFFEEEGFHYEPAVETAQAFGYIRDIPKLPNHLDEGWLALVHYRGWILRAIEEHENSFLLVGCGDKVVTCGVLDPIPPFAAGARWVARTECEVIQYRDDLDID